MRIEYNFCMIRFTDILKRSIAKAAALTLMATLLPVFTSCINDPEPPAEAEETYPIILNLNTRGLAIDGSGSGDAALVKDCLYIAAYKMVGSEYKFLYQLYNGNDKGLANLSGGASSLTLTAYLSGNLLEDVSTIAIAVYQVPKVAYSNNLDPDSGHAANPKDIFNRASLSNGLYSYGFNVEPLTQVNGGSNYYEGINMNGSPMYCCPMFGMSKDIDLSDLKSSSEGEYVTNNIGTIHMARSIAKVVVTAEDEVFSKIDNVRLRYQYNKVNLLPDLGNYKSEVIGKMNSQGADDTADLAYNFPNGASLSDIKNYVQSDGYSNMRFRKSGNEFYFYITEMTEEMFNWTINGDKIRNLIEAEYGGKIYPIIFTSYTDGSPDETPREGYDAIRRNHVYTFNILGVSNGKLEVKVKVAPWTKHEFEAEY